MRLDRGIHLGPEVHRLPLAIVEARRVPAGHGQPGVVRLAHQEVGLEDRAGGGLPVGAGGDVVGRAVGVLEVQHGPEPRVLAVMVALLAEADVAAVPAVGQDRSQGVGARLHAAGHVVGAVIDALGVVGPAGVEVIVADALAIEVQVEDPQRGGIQRGAADGLLYLEAWSAGSSAGGGPAWWPWLSRPRRGQRPTWHRGARSKPIHWPFQSEGCSRPIDQRAGVLQAEGLPSLSQTLTFQ